MDSEWLLEVSTSRLFEEVVKLFLGGEACRSFSLLRRYGLFALLFPDIDACLEEEGEAGAAAAFIDQALANTDARIAEEKPVTPAFLFAALLWPVLGREASILRADGESDAQAIESAGAHAIARQAGRMSIPRRCSIVTREIWEMQPRLLTRRGRRALGLTTRLRFRAAYDFLLLRAQAGEPVEKECDWWTRLLDSEGEGTRRASRPSSCASAAPAQEKTKGGAPRPSGARLHVDRRPERKAPFVGVRVKDVKPLETAAWWR